MPEQVNQLAQHVRTETAKAIVGHDESVDQILQAVLCGGHVLLEGVPGVAKTLLAKTVAHILELKFQRVQCTPDLMPADVVGTHIFDPSETEFRLRRGPVFTDLLLVDEINRTPPRTQSALLEAMQERQVTIDGERQDLSNFFTVLATQNPIEFEGTYPLPEAQLDRFLLKIRLPYPEAEDEVRILELHNQGFEPQHLAALGLALVPSAQLSAARAEVQKLRVESKLVSYIAAIIRRTREWPSVSLGASPRGGVYLLLVAKAQAAIEGRDYLLPDDVKSAAFPVLRHRLVLRPEAELEGINTDEVVREILSTVDIPT